MGTTAAGASRWVRDQLRDAHDIASRSAHGRRVLGASRFPHPPAYRSAQKPHRTACVSASRCVLLLLRDLHNWLLQDLCEPNLGSLLIACKSCFMIRADLASRCVLHQHRPAASGCMQTLLLDACTSDNGTPTSETCPVNSPYRNLIPGPPQWTHLMDPKSKTHNSHSNKFQ